MTDEMTADERRFRDTADWLAGAIARHRDEPGREQQVESLQRQLDDIKRAAVRQGWLAPDQAPRAKARKRAGRQMPWLATAG